MEFTFLGTSSGVPTLQRNVSGLVVKRQNRKTWFLVDCGEGTQHQLLRTPYSLVNLGAIFITHVHGDHTYGLPGLLASASMAGRKEPLTIFGPAGVEAFVRAAMTYTDVYASYELRFEVPEAAAAADFAPDVEVSAHALSHRVPSYAYSFTTCLKPRRLDRDKLEQAKIPRGAIWGQLAKCEDVTLEDGRIARACEYLLPPEPPLKAIVGGDNDSPDLLAAAAENAQLLIHESTYTQAVVDKVGPGPQHSSAKQVASFAERSGLPNLVLSHFSARYHRPEREGLSPLIDIENEARTYYSGNLFLAEDFDHFVLSADGYLEKRIP